MTLIYSTKKLFGGYKIASSDLFGVNTKFKGDYFDFIPEKDGVRVVSKDGSFSHRYENIRHLKGLNFFVCDFNSDRYNDIFDKRSYVDDEIYHTKRVCDTLTGRTFDARRVHQDYIVTYYSEIYFVNNGTISREPFEERAHTRESFQYTSKSGSYIITMDQHQNVNIVSSKGEYVLKNIISGRDSKVVIHEDYLPGNELAVYVENDKKIAYISKNGVIYETKNEPNKFLQARIVGDKYFIEEGFLGESQINKMTLFDSNNKKLSECTVPGSLWAVKEVEGEIVFVFAEGPFRSQKITEVKFSEYLATQSEEKHVIAETTAEKTEAEKDSKTTENNPKKPSTQMGE